MSNRTNPPTKRLETVEPVGKRVLIRKDEDKKITKVGIHLPDKMEIPTLTGRVVAVSAQVARDADYSVAQYDRVLFHPKNLIPEVAAAGWMRAGIPSRSYMRDINC